MVYWKRRVEAIEEKNAQQGNGENICTTCLKIYGYVRRTFFVATSSPSGFIICTKCYHKEEMR